MTASASHRRKRVVLLGATGSIGENTLRVLRAHADALELVGVAAHASTDKLLGIAREFDLSDSLILTAPVGYIAFSLLA